jgi:hypothetical protein
VVDEYIGSRISIGRSTCVFFLNLKKKKVVGGLMDLTVLVSCDGSSSVHFDGCSSCCVIQWLPFGMA